jgi:MYXO-CTERM domain-containing protein
MKNTKNIYGITFALAYSLASTLNAQVLDVSYEGAGNGVIGEYGLNGSTINAPLISGLGTSPLGIGISGNDLFVGSYYSGVVGEYTTSGATVNASLISGLYGPVGVVVSPVPEPSAGALASLSAAALWWLRRRK